MERRGGAAQAVVALFLVVVSGGMLLFGVPAGPAGEPAPATADFERFVERPGGPTVDHEVEVVASLEPGVAVPDELRASSGVTVAGSGDSRRVRGTLSLSEIRSLSDTEGVTGVRIDSNSVDVRDGGTAPGAAAVGATALHAGGVTGENVTVGVIDGGFRLSHPAVADQVTAYRTFGETGATEHGTAVASVVADTAPGSELHFAAVGPTTTPEEYRRAVRWLRASGADVIVDSGSYLAGDGRISAVAASAADDVVFVTSAGNYAQRHWAGVHEPVGTDGDVLSRNPGEESSRVRLTGDGDGVSVPGGVSSLLGGGGTDATATEWVRFDGARHNPLGTGPVSGRVTVAASWNTSADYDLYLVRETAAGEVVWASATGDDEGQERLSVVVPRGQYSLAVGYDGRSEAPSRLRLFANHRLGTHTPAGSLPAPATAEGVIAVGALADTGDGAAAFSSRGPVEGEPGVTLVAPDSVGPETTGGGTSFAAPYVAGTVALLQSEHPDVSATRIGDVVAAAAVDVGAPGRDPATGYGRLDAVGAARALDGLVAAEDRVVAETGGGSERTASASGTPLRRA